MKAVSIAGLCFAISSCTSDPSNISLPTPDCSLSSGPAISPASATLRVGDTVRVRATITPCEGLPRPTVFQWRSSDTLTARVDSITGLVRTKRTGTASIIATLVAVPAVQGAMALTVVP